MAAAEENGNYRDEIINRRKKQDQNDFKFLLNDNVEYRQALAVGDIIDLTKKRVPVLRSIEYKYKKTIRGRRISHLENCILPHIHDDTTSKWARSDSNKSVDSTIISSKISRASSNLSTSSHMTAKSSASENIEIILSMKESNPFRNESRDIDTKYNLPDASSRAKLLDALTSPQVKAARKKGIQLTVDAVLAQALSLMIEARRVVDSGRLYYEAALLFDDMAAYDRAIVCYLRSTKFCDASDVIASIDLPEDDTYRKKLERMSNSYLSDFHVKRSGLRERLLFAEKERQRLRVRAAYTQLFRIHLLTEQADFGKAHTYICEAVALSSNSSEHYDMMKFAHKLLSVFAAKYIDEMSVQRQIFLGSAGPLADAHINILHQLAEFEPENTEICDWLGRRYAEKGDYHEARKHFQDQRELLTRKPDFQETMELWKAFPQQNKAANSSSSSKETALAEYIQASSCKSLWNSHETMQEVSEPTLTAKRQDFSSFGGRVHLDTGIAVYKIPLQGWEGIS